MRAAIFCRFFPVILAAALLSGCATLPQMNPFFGGNTGAVEEPVKNLEPLPPQKRHTFWDSDGATGAPQIVVKLGEQRAYFYRGKKAIGGTRISSGKPGFSTPAGAYRVVQKHKDHVSTLYGDFVGEDGTVVKANADTSKDRAPAGASFRGAKMPYFLRFHNGYGLHAGRVPNYPASHGCVRLPSEMARHFFENAAVGTLVRVEAE